MGKFEQRVIKAYKQRQLRGNVDAELSKILYQLLRAKNLLELYLGQSVQTYVTSTNFREAYFFIREPNTLAQQLFQQPYLASIFGNSPLYRGLKKKILWNLDDAVRTVLRKEKGAITTIYRLSQAIEAIETLRKELE